MSALPPQPRPQNLCNQFRNHKYHYSYSDLATSTTTTAAITAATTTGTQCTFNNVKFGPP